MQGILEMPCICANLICKVFWKCLASVPILNARHFGNALHLCQSYMQGILEMPCICANLKCKAFWKCLALKKIGLTRNRAAQIYQDHEYIRIVCGCTADFSLQHDWNRLKPILLSQNLNLLIQHPAICLYTHYVQAFWQIMYRYGKSFGFQ